MTYHRCGLPPGVMEPSATGKRKAYVVWSERKVTLSLSGSADLLASS